MSNQQVKLQISGLTQLERIELEEFLSPEALQFEERSMDDDSHGDLGTTIAIVIVSVAALKALTAWLLSTRQGQSFRQTVVIKYPDGSEEERTIEYNNDSSEAPDAKILEQFQSMFISDIKFPVS